MITATILGRLGADPETKTIGTGHQVTECRVATTTKRGREEVTTWVRASIWGARGEAFARFHRKGSRCFLTGELVNRAWETNEGETRYSLELDVSGWAFAESKGEASAPAPSRATDYGKAAASPDDDLPF